MADPISDPVRDAIRRGEKDEALRLIVRDGLWVAFCDPGYFDTKTCFPVFSSPQLIPQYLRSVGFGGDSIKAQQLDPRAFQVISSLDSAVTLNPGTDSEWVFSSVDFSAIAAYAKKG